MDWVWTGYGLGIDWVWTGYRLTTGWLQATWLLLARAID